jgi:uncharacterized RDD family membrane protein YckC
MYIMFFGHDNDEGGKSVEGLMVLPIPTLWFIYFVVVEAFSGATLAHQALYLKVTTLDRRQIGFTQALKRHLLDPIDILFWAIPGIIAISLRRLFCHPLFLSSPFFVIPSGARDLNKRLIC